ncbi:hypothetical protein JT358_15995 [Micrococcales bacterium 31B]|nr:hypothetical protein [Micrococcales bacterium 31B]
MSKYVSCDATITDQLGFVGHGSTGTLAFNKIKTEHAFTQYVTAKSSNGNYLPWLAVNQGTVSWPSVLPSTYTFYIRPVQSQNCNGWLPGDGNTYLTYSFTHN